jgi:amidase
MAGLTVTAMLAGFGLAAPEGGGSVDVVEKDIAELQHLMEDGEATSEQIVGAYLGRIEQLDEELRSVLAVNPAAIEQARRRDAERRDGRVRGPLHGIPVLLKDNVESREPMPTTAGSLALEENVTGRDAFLVAKLRDAGAVILGKANLSEWANFRSERSSSGWSAIGGQTRNPYDPTRTPCGSSSGSAVAVAASLTAVAIGTETNGSVVCPCTVNGIVGIKPTVGLVSRSRIVPISHTQDTAGPMGRTVRDAVVVLQSMIGRDPGDPATQIAERASGWSLEDRLREDGLKGKRIGVVRSLAGFHSDVDDLLDAAVADLQAAGAVVVDGLAFDPPEGLSEAAYELLLFEFKHDLNAYLAGLPEGSAAAQTLGDLIAFNEQHADREMPYFGQTIFIKAQATGGLGEEEYQEALDRVRRATREDGIDALLADHELDGLVAPTGSPAWKIDLINGDHFLGGSSSYPARAGYPHITVPMGWVHGLPVGLSFFGTALSEPTLIEMAYAYEQATGHRRPPR